MHLTTPWMRETYRRLSQRLRAAFELIRMKLKGTNKDSGER